uniref:Uncharacterized protein n=1 Tax=Eptatretus burgeri TaxID=7764 RepID=A0A8C4R3F2_EPTBU
MSNEAQNFCSHIKHCHDHLASMDDTSLAPLAMVAQEMGGWKHHTFQLLLKGMTLEKAILPPEPPAFLLIRVVHLFLSKRQASSASLSFFCYHCLKKASMHRKWSYGERMDRESPGKMAAQGLGRIGSDKPKCIDGEGLSKLSGQGVMMCKEANTSQCVSSVGSKRLCGMESGRASPNKDDEVLGRARDFLWDISPSTFLKFYILCASESNGGKLPDQVKAIGEQDLLATVSENWEEGLRAGMKQLFCSVTNLLLDTGHFDIAFAVCRLWVSFRCRGHLANAIQLLPLSSIPPVLLLALTSAIHQQFGSLELSLCMELCLLGLRHTEPLQLQALSNRNFPVSSNSFPGVIAQALASNSLFPIPGFQSHSFNVQETQPLQHSTEQLQQRTESPEYNSEPPILIAEPPLVIIESEQLGDEPPDLIAEPPHLVIEPSFYNVEPPHLVAEISWSCTEPPCLVAEDPYIHLPIVSQHKNHHEISGTIELPSSALAQPPESCSVASSTLRATLCLTVAHITPTGDKDLRKVALLAAFLACPCSSAYLNLKRAWAVEQDYRFDSWNHLPGQALESSSLLQGAVLESGLHSPDCTLDSFLSPALHCEMSLELKSSWTFDPEFWGWEILNRELEKKTRTSEREFTIEMRESIYQIGEVDMESSIAPKFDSESDIPKTNGGAFVTMKEGVRGIDRTRKNEDICEKRELHRQHYSEINREWQLESLIERNNEPWKFIIDDGPLGKEKQKDGDLKKRGEDLTLEIEAKFEKGQESCRDSKKRGRRRSPAEDYISWRSLIRQSRGTSQKSRRGRGSRGVQQTGNRLGTGPALGSCCGSQKRVGRNRGVRRGRGVRVNHMMGLLAAVQCGSGRGRGVASNREGRSTGVRLITAFNTRGGRILGAPLLSRVHCNNTGEWKGDKIKLKGEKFVEFVREKLGDCGREKLGEFRREELGEFRREELGEFRTGEWGAFERGELSRERLGELGREKLGELGREKLGGLERDRLGELEREKLGELEREKLGELERDRLGELERDRLGELGRDRLGELGRDRLGELGRDRLGELGRDRLGELGRDRLGELGRERLGGLGRDQLGGLGRDRLGELGRDQLGELGTDRLGELGRNRLGEFQREKLGEWQHNTLLNGHDVERVLYHQREQDKVEEREVVEEEKGERSGTMHGKGPGVADVGKPGYKQTEEEKYVQVGTCSGGEIKTVEEVGGELLRTYGKTSAKQENSKIEGFHLCLDTSGESQYKVKGNGWNSILDCKGFAKKTKVKENIERNNDDISMKQTCNMVLLQEDIFELIKEGNENNSTKNVKQVKESETKQERTVWKNQIKEALIVDHKQNNYRKQNRVNAKIKEKSTQDMEKSKVMDDVIQKNMVHRISKNKALNSEKQSQVAVEEEGLWAAEEEDVVQEVEEEKWHRLAGEEHWLAEEECWSVDEAEEEEEEEEKRLRVTETQEEKLKVAEAEGERLRVAETEEERLKVSEEGERLKVTEEEEERLIEEEGVEMLRQAEEEEMLNVMEEEDKMHRIVEEEQKEMLRPAEEEEMLRESEQKEMLRPAEEEEMLRESEEKEAIRMAEEEGGLRAVEEKEGLCVVGEDEERLSVEEEKGLHAVEKEKCLCRKKEEEEEEALCMVEEEEGLQVVREEEEEVLCPVGMVEGIRIVEEEGSSMAAEMILCPANLETTYQAIEGSKTLVAVDIPVMAKKGSQVPTEKHCQTLVEEDSRTFTNLKARVQPNVGSRTLIDMKTRFMAEESSRFTGEEVSCNFMDVEMHIPTEDVFLVSEERTQFLVKESSGTLEDVGILVALQEHSWVMEKERFCIAAEESSPVIMEKHSHLKAENKPSTWIDVDTHFPAEIGSLISKERGTHDLVREGSGTLIDVSMPVLVAEEMNSVPSEEVACTPPEKVAHLPPEEVSQVPAEGGIPLMVGVIAHVREEEDLACASAEEEGSSIQLKEGLKALTDVNLHLTTEHDTPVSEERVTRVLKKLHSGALMGEKTPVSVKEGSLVHSKKLAYVKTHVLEEACSRTKIDVKNRAMAEEGLLAIAVECSQDPPKESLRNHVRAEGSRISAEDYMIPATESFSPLMDVCTSVLKDISLVLAKNGSDVSMKEDEGILIDVDFCNSAEVWPRLPAETSKSMTNVETNICEEECILAKEGPGVPAEEGHGVPAEERHGVQAEEGPGMPEEEGPRVPAKEEPGPPAEEGIDVPVEGPCAPMEEGPGALADEEPDAPAEVEAGVPAKEGPDVPVKEGTDALAKEGLDVLVEKGPGVPAKEGPDVPMEEGAGALVEEGPWCVCSRGSWCAGGRKAWCASRRGAWCANGREAWCTCGRGAWCAGGRGAWCAGKRGA